MLILRPIIYASLKSNQLIFLFLVWYIFFCIWLCCHLGKYVNRLARLLMRHGCPRAINTFGLNQQLCGQVIDKSLLMIVLKIVIFDFYFEIGTKSNTIRKLKLFPY